MAWKSRYGIRLVGGKGELQLGWVGLGDGGGEAFSGREEGGGGAQATTERTLSWYLCEIEMKSTGWMA